MKLSFPVPSTRAPVGGIAISYEFAEALVGRGHDVAILHHELFGGDAVGGLDEIAWYDFDPRISHVFVDGPVADISALPDADIFVGHSQELEDNPRLGLPVKMIQGWQMYQEEQEVAAFRSPCPKACVAVWLQRIGEELGVPSHELVHTPLGLHHDRFQVTTGLDNRPQRVSFCWNPHPMKGATLALEVLEEVQRLRPDTIITAFGTRQPDVVPDWIEFIADPTPEVLVDDIYNGSAVFLCTSVVEGFGLTNLEAMACGATLVTTDNGGSQDYARPQTTARVSPARHAQPLVDNVVGLLDDPTERQRIGSAGRAHAASFTWERSAEIMERFFAGYLADPQAFGRPR